MDHVYIVGIGMTRLGKWLDRSVKNLTREAVELALADAGCERSDIGAAFFANAGQGVLEGQSMIRGQLALRDVGFASIPIFNVENACASASTAFHLAVSHLRAGESGAVLAVGSEKMYTTDKARNFALFHGGLDVHGIERQKCDLATLRGTGNFPTDAEGAGGHSVFMDIYASLAKQHMRRFGTTERQLAMIASKNHRHSTLNPLSQYQTDMSVDEVLAARRVAWPLTVPMCAPLSDGAAAAVLCRADALHRFDRSRAVRVLSTVVASGSDRAAEDAEHHICRIAADKAYARAGVGPEDMSVAELHDAAAVAEIIQAENLGFCAFGEGGPMAERGETALGGRLPINTSGGLESKGHPIGATGLAQIHELVAQLRGEAGRRQVSNARFGIAENGGGFQGFEEAAACVTILGRDSRA